MGKEDWNEGSGDKKFSIWILCNKKVPRLPGGATIRCHFWNSVVFRQSRGLSEYALCLDMSSCIGSRMTQSCERKSSNVSQMSQKVLVEFHFA
jgi:hypothetical protein